MKKYLLFLCCLCASMLAFAQQQTVTGTVVDEAGLPLIGVSKALPTVSLQIWMVTLP